MFPQHSSKTLVQKVSLTKHGLILDTNSTTIALESLISTLKSTNTAIKELIQIRPIHGYTWLLACQNQANLLSFYLIKEPNYDTL